MNNKRTITMTIADLKLKTEQLINKYPDNKEELTELYQLAIDEIEQGGSEYNECELAYNDMLECTNEYEESEGQRLRRLWL